MRINYFFKQFSVIMEYRIDYYHFNGCNISMKFESKKLGVLFVLHRNIRVIALCELSSLEYKISF